MEGYVRLGDVPFPILVQECHWTKDVLIRILKHTHTVPPPSQRNEFPIPYHINSRTGKWSLDVFLARRQATGQIIDSCLRCIIEEHYAMSTQT